MGTKPPNKTFDQMMDELKKPHPPGWFGTDTTDRLAYKLWYDFTGARWLTRLVGKARRLWQRLTWGWDESEVWSLDWTFARWITPRLKLLRTEKHGVPYWCFPDGAQYQKPCGNPTDEAFRIAQANWDACMEVMISGFGLLCSEDYHQYEDTCIEKVQAAFDMFAKCHGSLWD